MTPSLLINVRASGKDHPATHLLLALTVAGLINAKSTTVFVDGSDPLLGGRAGDAYSGRSETNATAPRLSAMFECTKHF